MQICFLFLATKLNTKKFLLTLQVTKNLFSISSLIFFSLPFIKPLKIFSHLNSFCFSLFLIFFVTLPWREQFYYGLFLTLLQSQGRDFSPALYTGQREGSLVFLISPPYDAVCCPTFTGAIFLYSAILLLLASISISLPYLSELFPLRPLSQVF